MKTTRRLLVALAMGSLVVGQALAQSKVVIYTAAPQDLVVKADRGDRGAHQLQEHHQQRIGTVAQCRDDRRHGDALSGQGGERRQKSGCAQRR